ncbi:MAG: hypothetical protein JSU73_06890 [candidate division WOR-3 bacterium]|nr:MAG: hypothetical protein JSU73_06890 [candidate division WOR-3 bacterium]
MRKSTLLCALLAVLVAGVAIAIPADLMPYPATEGHGPARILTLAERACTSEDVPPFGTIIQAWSLTMSGRYAGAGVTWCRSSGRLFLMDQGSSGQCRVWNLDPADPTGTIVSVPWTFVNLGSGIVDKPWGIAWDPDSGCFWSSQILDNNVYGGCFLLRYVWSGSAWVWGGGAQDSWQVGDATQEIGLQCLWTAGMEKNALNRVFYCAPVHSSPSSLNHIARFDPYTKTDLGRLQYGSETSERGCALIPWDSAYVLTLGPNAEQFVKRDSTGYPLTAVSSPEWPADWSVIVPDAISTDDTVFAYCMRCNSENNLYKVCTGLEWGQLPSAFRHSVRPVCILEPSGTIDSGEVVMPTVVVHNSSDEPALDVSVHLQVDNDRDSVVYHDSTQVTIPALSSDTVEFTPWTALDRDSATAVAWTFWEDDSVPGDDTLAQRFLVLVKALEIVDHFPKDTVEPGPHPAWADCLNSGNVVLSYPVVFFICELGHRPPWFDTTWAVNHLAGATHRMFPYYRPNYFSPGIYEFFIGGLLGEPFADTFWVLSSGVQEPKRRAGPVFELTAVPSAFGAELSLVFGLDHEVGVDLAVYSGDGRRVRTLASGRHQAGRSELVWDGRDDLGRRVAPGAYLVRLSAPGRFSGCRVAKVR